MEKSLPQGASFNNTVRQKLKEDLLSADAKSNNNETLMLALKRELEKKQSQSHKD